MRYSKTEQKLLDAMAQMKIIDCHEHLPPEKVRTDSQQDVFTLFSHYTRHDLLSAGLDADIWGSEDKKVRVTTEYESLFDYDIPIEKRWKKFKPYWERIRYGSYARAARLTAKSVYGFDDINDDTYKPLSEAIAAENTPGIYKRILYDKCNIHATLTLEHELLDYSFPLEQLIYGTKVTQIRDRGRLEEVCSEVDMIVPKTVDDFMALCKVFIRKWVDGGVVGIKFLSQYHSVPDRGAAQTSLDRLLNGETLIIDERRFEPLENLLTDHFFSLAGEYDLPVAMHAGIWGDFRMLDSKFMLDIAVRHPQTKFDLFHLGMPFVRDTIVIAKNYPNVFLNLCWCHIVSQVQTCSGIDEIIDQVPINKIFAFGGDYTRPVEKVAGHLHMGKEDLAIVFGHRVDRGLMSFDEAVKIIRQWFWDNPLQLYQRLKIAR